MSASKEKVSGVKLEGWVENKLLNLGDNVLNFVSDKYKERVHLTAPDCSDKVLELDSKYSEYFRFINPKDYLGEIIKAVNDINSHASECVVENGLHAEAPFNMAENTKIGEKDNFCVMTLYPTKVNGLFVALQTSDTGIIDEESLSLCRVDGMKVAKMANGGNYKTKVVEKTVFERAGDSIEQCGKIVSKLAVAEKKIVDLTPESKKETNVFIRK